MAHKKLIATLVGCTVALAGCNSSDKENKATAAQDKVTVTAMDGYLINAKIYKQDEKGTCLKDGKLLGTTNNDGQVSIEKNELSDGYCAVTDTATIDKDNPGETLTEGYTLYSPAPQLLGSVDSPVISPLTTYIHNTIKELDTSATEQEIKEAIKLAKSDLAGALLLDSSSDDITTLLTSDYIEAKKTAEVKDAAESLHTMAQLLVGVNDEEQSLNKKQVINIARTLKAYGAIATGELEKIAVYIKGNINEFNKDTDEPVEIDSSVLKDIPQPLSTKSESLKQQLNAKISEAADARSDKSASLQLSNVEITNITDNNNTEADVTYVLTQKMVGSPFDATSVVPDITFKNDVLTIPSLSFSQKGKYEFKLYIKKTIEDKEYQSKSIEFDVTVTEEQVANTAPQYKANSAVVSQLLENLVDTAEGSGAFNDEMDMSDFGGGILPAYYNFTAYELNLAGLFSDDSDEPVTVKLHLNSADFSTIEESKLPELTGPDEDTGTYSFGSGEYPIPETDSKSYRMTIYAEDKHGAKSNSGFEFTLTINSNETATLTSNQSEGISNETSGGFTGTLLSAATLSKIESQIAAYLNDSRPEPVKSLDTLIEIGDYLCTKENECKKVKGNGGNYSLSDNTYLEIDNDQVFLTTFRWTGKKVESEQTILLTPKSNDKEIKIYSVDSPSSVKVDDLNNYATSIKLIISPNTGSGVTVKASLASR
ncbi:hypothetical protein C942_00276 [Photobacterium marinum]|uniref:Dystroglycan-type cadherin-like domain-containing protein n=1 Tax=Photobacterium marinum TaxID=1056511 RepID=L8JFE0_9GAMM|nr:hypothetical protein [Photobacterium marinum]ELR66219.1 hypothetical protein C942_00276 [Photobacterium marinum]